MKTELETYVDLIDTFLKKEDTYLLEINPREGIEKSIGFYTIIGYKDQTVKDKHFWFVSGKLDDNAIADIELGIGNLRENGYKIIYRNNSK